MDARGSDERHHGVGGADRLPLQRDTRLDPGVGATYHLGIDGISAWILALNAGVFLLGAVLVSRRSTDRLKLFCGLLLLTEAMTAGVLMSLDLVLFYLFWEGMLIPLYFLLANYGNENRGRATLKFIIYTVAGSLLMLVAIIALGFGTHQGFDLTQLLGGRMSHTPLVIPGLNISTFSPEQLAFLAFAAAFAIKIPLVPFHTWLPDLYESAPVPVLVFFAGLVSKLGAYGFIRFGLTLFPDAMNTFKWLFAALAVLSIIYGALMALSERDLKRIVAYSSISHLGFIALGIFTLTTNGVNGAVIQIVNHGIIIAALFIIVGIVEERTGTRDIRELSGLEKRMPWLYGFFLVATLAGLGMPGMNSFAGEFSIMLGAFQLHPAYAVLAGVGVVLACWYMLRLHQGLMHDPPSRAPRESATFGQPGTRPSSPDRPDGVARSVPAANWRRLPAQCPADRGAGHHAGGLDRRPHHPRGFPMTALAALPPLTTPSGVDILGIMPEVILGGGFVVLLMLDLVTSAAHRGWLAGFSLVAVAASFGSTVWGWFDAATPHTVYFGSFAYDRFGLFVNAIILVSTALVLMISPQYLNRRGLHYGEYYR